MKGFLSCLDYGVCLMFLIPVPEKLQRHMICL